MTSEAARQRPAPALAATAVETASPAPRGSQRAQPAGRLRVRAGAASRALAGLVGLAALALAGWLALHHPLSHSLAAAGIAALAVAQFAWPPAWLVLLPALMPWLGLAPWTGWLGAEELDLVVLALAGGAYLRWALRPWATLRSGPGDAARLGVALLLLALWCTSVAVSMSLGVADAGGWHFDWYQGYREPLNALRLAKPTLGLLLLWPLWRLVQAHPAFCAGERLTLGLQLALLGIGLWCVYERLAYPGLLNFAADYRTTGPFWEMHVGGAALDAALALTLPFAALGLSRARSPASMALGIAVLVLGLYAALTTFSRIVYAALPLMGLAWVLLSLHRGRTRGWPQPTAHPAAHGERPNGDRSGGGGDGGRALGAASLEAPTAAGLGWLVTTGLLLLGCAAWMFPTAGHRGNLALLANGIGLLLIVPGMVGARRRAGQRRALRLWVTAVVGFAAAAAGVAAFGLALDKGAYIGFAAVTAAGVFAAWRARDRSAHWAWALGLWWAQLAATVLVAQHWGGPDATAAALFSALALAVWGTALALRASRPWVMDLRRLGVGGAILGSAMLTLAIFQAGDYMGDRMAASESDRDYRQTHWRQSLSLRRGTGEAVWGIGLGRYVDRFAQATGPQDRPGDVRWLEEGGIGFVRLMGGTHTLGDGELLRLSQRIEAPAGRPATVQIVARSQKVSILQVEICRKHLIYPGSCDAQAVRLDGGTDTGWQTLNLRWPAALPPNGDGIARFVVFSLAQTSPGQAIDVRDVSLQWDGQPSAVLRNGDFSAHTRYWYLSSDKFHMPWHAKNLAIHLLVEQGWAGLLTFAALVLSALMGLDRRVGGQRPLVVALLVALLGMLVVGAVDSILDMPRVGLWLLLVPLLALGVRAQGPAASGNGEPLGQGAR